MVNNKIAKYRQEIQERVAIEFGYEKESIREVLRHKFFDCSGGLADYLFLLNDKEIKKAYLSNRDYEYRKPFSLHVKNKIRSTVRSYVSFI